MSDRASRRPHQQFTALVRRFSALQWLPALTATRSGLLLCVPLAGLLVTGGLGFLPILGVWMIPLGLLILAIALPVLRPGVSAVLIRGPRRLSLWRRGWTGRR